jgi:hypothetical protein
MACSTRFEFATSAGTAGSKYFKDMEEHGRHPKSLEVRRRPRYCVSPCAPRRFLSTVTVWGVISGLHVIKRSSVLLVGKRYGGASFAIRRIDYGDGYCVTNARHLIHVSGARHFVSELVCIFHS